jgi:hypothetical protein
MAKLKDYSYLIGKTFRKLTILSTERRQNNTNKYTSVYCFCRCECGNEKWVSWSCISGGETAGCGCQRAAENIRRVTHGLTRNGKSTGLIKTYRMMKVRCYNENHIHYKDYGGRGITVCERWLDKKQGFFNFMADMGDKPTPNHTLDRIENDKGYGPDNCRWATQEEQCNNTRVNVWIEYNGERRTIAQWTRHLGFKRPTLKARLRKGWPIEKALTTPLRGQKIN